jgi:hypothetical protein
MGFRKLLAATAVLVAVSGTGLWLSGCTGNSPSGATDQTGVTAPGGQAEEGVVYTCPMHPEVVSDHPGKCPICGMNLVKKEKPAEQMNMNNDMGHMNMEGGSAGEAKK